MNFTHQIIKAAEFLVSGEMEDDGPLNGSIGDIDWELGEDMDEEIYLDISSKISKRGYVEVTTKENKWKNEWIEGGVTGTKSCMRSQIYFKKEDIPYLRFNFIDIKTEQDEFKARYLDVIISHIKIVQQHFNISKDEIIRRL